MGKIYSYLRSSSVTKLTMAPMVTARPLRMQLGASPSSRSLKAAVRPANARNARLKVRAEDENLEKAKAIFANPVVSKGMWSVAVGVALATDCAFIDPQEWITNVGVSAELIPVIQGKLQQVAILHVLCLAGVAYFAKEKEFDTSTTIKSLGKTAACGPLAFAEVALLDEDQLRR